MRLFRKLLKSYFGIAVTLSFITATVVTGCKMVEDFKSKTNETVEQATQTVNDTIAQVSSDYGLDTLQDDLDAFKNEFDSQMSQLEGEYNEYISSGTSSESAILTSNSDFDIYSLGLDEVFTANTDGYVEINGNIPFFSDSDLGTDVGIYLTELDSKGRCGSNFAVIDQTLLPTEERGEIGHVKPTGWNQAKYEGVVDSDPPYLYNRCHLLGFQLTGLNDDVRNLITGTRYFNASDAGMLPFENQAAKLVKNGNTIAYRVTPYFDGEDLLARGVLMEMQVIPSGKHYCVFVYNTQPGVEINYSTGENKLLEE